MKRRSIIADAVLYIYKLKLKLEEIKRELSILEAIKREYLSMLKRIKHLPKVCPLSSILFHFYMSEEKLNIFTLSLYI